MTSEKVFYKQSEKALKEALIRKEKEKEKVLPKEIRGRGGLEPTRYGDWEVKGIASDF